MGGIKHGYGVVVVIGLLWQLDWWVFSSCVLGMDSKGVLQGVLPTSTCYYLGNLSIRQV